MNWVLIGVIAVIAFNAFSGAKKGMIRLIFSLGVLVATILLTVMIAPLATGFVKDNTKIYQNIETATYKSIVKNNTVSNAFIQIGKQDVQIDSSNPGSEITGITDQVVDTLALPASLRKEIQSKIDVEGFVADGMASAQDMVAKFISTQIATIIFNVIMFVVIFALIYIIMQIIIVAGDILSRLPVIRQVNKAGGMVLGAFKGLIVVWVFFIAITMFCDTEFAKTVFAYVNEDSFLAFIYNNNLILKLIFMVI